ncbi:MAG: alpha-N-arabinofuranosidase, partial [Acidobacteriaceae bacterium]|nr:alpha-N-arabinofuranosidase [Acidobacteriaceae bacterium]
MSFFRFQLNRCFALAFCVAAASAWLAWGQQAPPASLEIHADKPIAKVSPTLYGLMTEEINYSYDGGLYAELVRNRTFHDSNWDLPAWSLVEKGDSVAHMKLDKTTGPSKALPMSLKIDIEKADAANQAGIQNAGFWGFPIRSGTTYRGSVYVKASSTALGPLTVMLID